MELFNKWAFYFTDSIGAGLITVLQVLVVSAITTILFGLVVAVVRMSPIKPMKWCAQAYIEVFRGTPLLVQILILFAALPILTGWFLTSFQTAILAMTLNSGSYMAESYRSGLEAVPAGQREAAASLGMGPLLAFRRVVLPQAIRIVLPAIGNTVTGMLLATSFIFLVGLNDMMARANLILWQTGDFSIYVLVTLIYVSIGLVLVGGTKYMEARFKQYTV
jgi:polar amino acid transport system permease protein